MKKLVWLLGSLASLGCAADPAPKQQGFTPMPDGKSCASAILVTESDYTSTNVSALSPGGQELADSFISSSSAPPGLSTALSGDIVFPSSAPASGEVVLIDRYPNSVITFVEPTTAKVERQIAVGTGFGANPHDYLELSATEALVTRYEANPKPGREDFDNGSDVLVINPKTGKLLESIDMTTADDGDYLPRPDRLLRMGDEVWVVLQGLSQDFKKERDARIVAINVEDHSIAWTLRLDGFQNCGGLALAPSGEKLALACSGFLGDELAPSPQSDVVLLDVTQSPPTITRNYNASQQLGTPLGSSIAFVSESVVLGTALGDGASHNDVAYTLDLDGGSAKVQLDAGGSFALGGAHCAPGCDSAFCYMTDAQSQGIDVWEIAPKGKLSPQQPIAIGTSVGLPPRSLGTL